MSPTRTNYDLIIVGGGVAGCVLAAAAAEVDGLSVLLIEAGTDYGPREQDWPAGVLDARQLPRQDLWEPKSQPHSWRGKILGGSSCVNGCWHTWGADGDYDRWAELAGDSWSAKALEPYRAEAVRTLGVRPVAPAEISLWTEASVAAARGLGYPFVEDLAAPGWLGGSGSAVAVGLPPINAAGDRRRNAAFGYLGGCRASPSVQILDRASVDQLIWSGTRVSAVAVRTPDGTSRYDGGQVVLTAGTIGSPILLQRSGIGDPDRLAAAGVPVRRELPGVGANLSDHPGVTLPLTATVELAEALAGIEARGQLYASQACLLAASSVCESGSWDLHLLPTAGGPLFAERVAGEYEVGITAFLMKQRSRGQVSITSPDPEVPPRVEHDYLSDAGGADLQALADGLVLAGELAGSPQLRRLATAGSPPDLSGRDPAALARYRQALGTYWHPVGTCAAGTGAQSVVDGRGRVHGFDNLSVLDASILPSTPRANTQLSVLATASMLSELLLTELR
ncbi:MAG: GMC family oxidoreductase [Jatrophihabitans sp.]